MPEGRYIFYERELRIAGLVLRAADHKIRLHICQFIKEVKTASTKEISENLEIDDLIISQHMGILNRAGILERNRDGSGILYKLNHQRIERIEISVKMLQ